MNGISESTTQPRSGFVDDVMFSHNGLCGASCVFISGKNVRALAHNQILLNDNETRSASTHRVLHTGAKSAICYLRLPCTIIGSNSV